MATAFFDLDLTLLEMNTASLWLKRELRLGNVGYGFFVKSAWRVMQYQLGVAKMEQVIEKTLMTFAGAEVAPLVERTNEFWTEEVKGHFRPGALDALAMHRERGDKLVLLTSSSPYMSAPVAAELELDGVCCTVPEVDDGKFTGRAVGPLCFGPGKVLKAQAWLDEHGGDLESASFYTDSFSDLPVLEVVGHPVAVHPDPRLRRHAERVGWPIAIWGKTASGKRR